MDGCVVLNVVYSRDDGEIPTVLKVPYDICWQDLELLLKLNFDCSSLVVKYLDEDEDFILLSSQPELEEALKHAKVSKHLLHLNVRDTSAETQAIERIVPIKPAPTKMADSSTPPPTLSKIAEADSTATVQEAMQALDLSANKREDANSGAADVICDGTVTMETQDDTKETGETIHTQALPNASGAAEVQRGARPRSRHSRRSESCYTRCAREIGAARRSQSQPEPPVRCPPEIPPRPPTSDLGRDQESGEIPRLDAPVPLTIQEFLKKLKEDLRTEIVRDVTRKTVKQVLKGLDGAVIQAVQGSQTLPVTKATPDVTETDTCIPTEHPSYIHDGVICDSCDKTIVGVRYKCGNCEDYDLCENCEAVDGVHSPDHVFLKLRRPWVGAGKVAGVSVPLLRCLVYQPDEQTDGQTGGTEDPVSLPRWEKIKEKMAKMQEKFKKKEERLMEKHKRKEEKLKRRLEHERSLPVKREKLDIPQLKRQGKYAADFVEDLTIPDGTRVQPGTKMMKMWMMKNTGNVRWSSSTKLRMVWGSMEAAQPEVDVPHLSPGECGSVTVEIIAPPTAGRYQSHWKLHNSGSNFGHRVWCAIIVEPKEVLEPTSEESLKVVQDNAKVEGDKVTALQHDDLALEEDGPGERSESLEDPSILSVPMVALVSAMPVDVVAAVAKEEDQMPPAKVDRIEEDLTTAAAVVAQLQKDGEETLPQKLHDVHHGSDLLSFEMVDAENHEVRRLTQTATPNNTPLVLTPPKTPVLMLPPSGLLSPCGSVELVGEEALEAEMEDVVSEDASGAEMVDYVQEKMASLTFNSDIPYELESLPSSSDDEDDTSSSDGDFFVVPLPDCFHPDKPMTRSQSYLPCDENCNVTQANDLTSEKSVDEILSTSSSVQTPTLSPVEAHSVGCGMETKATEEGGTMASIDRAESIDMASQTFEKTTDVAVSVDEVTASKTEELPKGDNPDSTTEEPAKAEETVDELQRKESTDAEGAAANPGPADQTTPEEPATSNKPATDKPTSEKVDQQQAKAGEFANQLMSTAVTAATRAATHAYSTAKEVFLTWQAKHAEGQAQYVPSKPQTNSTAPKKRVVPENKWTPPQSTWTPPENKWTPPPDTWTPPENKWTPPKNSWTPPPDNWMPPENKWTPPPDTWTPSKNTWTPPEDNWTPPSDEFVRAAGTSDTVTADTPESGSAQGNPEITSAMQNLVEMGFFNLERNRELLETCGQDLEKVIAELVSGNFSN